MSILSVSLAYFYMLQKGGGLSEPTLYVSSEFAAPDKIRKKRRMEFSLKRATFFPGWHGEIRYGRGEEIGYDRIYREGIGGD